MNPSYAMLCQVCSGTRKISIPAREATFLGRIFTVSAHQKACPECAQVKLRAVRTHCVTGVTGIAPIVLEYRFREGQHEVFISEGGATGCESVYADENFLINSRLHGWLACFGTEGRYDKLFIPAAEMRKGLAKFGL
jgi:hypothetical protein